MITLYDVGQIQVIQRDIFPAWNPCWPGLTDKSSATAGGVKIDFMFFLEAEWGTGPLNINSNLRIHVINIKHTYRH